MKKEQIESIIFDKMKADAVYKAAKESVKISALLILERDYKYKIFTDNGIKYKAIKFVVDTWDINQGKIAIRVFTVLFDENYPKYKKAAEIAEKEIEENNWYYSNHKVCLSVQFNYSVDYDIIFNDSLNLVKDR
jgi:hypothetical protein